MPPQYLPAWLSPLSEFLPVGAAVRALQGLAHFKNDGLLSGLVTLTLWTVVCAGVIRLKEARSARDKAPVPSVVQ
ncbi:hypothetical protein [Streptomyces cyaneofuscatus]|uniref:hypothetical protein n=1 Tax=Streptomyces cyaneofuscatus TaxID=66883 RepID=UPI00364B4B96